MSLFEKACSKCEVVKPLALFKKNSRCKGGYGGQCKCCVNDYLKEKRDAGFYKANREKSNVNSRAHYYKNRDKYKTKQAEYQKENRAKYNSYEAKRRAKLLMATVGWSCQEAIDYIYKQAKQLGMEVDHVIPLQGVQVCGLHCEDNLQLLTPYDNRSKGNRI